MKMRGNVVHHWIKTLLDSWEDQRYAATVHAKQRRRGKPDIVAAPPWRIALDDAPGMREPSHVAVKDGQPVWSSGGRALHVIAFQQQPIVDRKLRAKFLRTAGSKQEQAVAFAHRVAP